MAKKLFTVVIAPIENRTYEIEASNKQAAQNRAIRMFREEVKNPAIQSVERTKDNGAVEGEVPTTDESDES